jgi:hypothetical protein
MGVYNHDMTKKPRKTERTVIIPGEPTLLAGSVPRWMLKRMKKEWRTIVLPMSAAERQCVTAGVKAWEDTERTWEDWLKISNALQVGEKICRDEAGKDEGGRYNRLYSAWLLQQGLDAIPSSVRSYLKTLRENRIEVEQYRAWLPDEKRMRLNDPKRVLEGYLEWKAAQK